MINVGCCSAMHIQRFNATKRLCRAGFISESFNSGVNFGNNESIFALRFGGIADNFCPDLQLLPSFS